MDPPARAASVWYRIAGLISREQKSLAVEIIEAEVRSAQHEVLIEAARLVLFSEQVEIARQLRDQAERTIRVTSFTSHELHEIPSLNCLSSYGGHDGAADDSIAIRPRLGEEFCGPFSRLGCQRAKDKVAVVVRRLDLEVREPLLWEEPTQDAFDHRLCQHAVRYAIRAIIRFSVA